MRCKDSDETLPGDSPDGFEHIVRPLRHRRWQNRDVNVGRDDGGRKRRRRRRRGCIVGSIGGGECGGTSRGFHAERV